MSVELGDLVVCAVTGFQGVAVGILDRISGARMVEVQPMCGTDNEKKESVYFNVGVLSIEQKGYITVPPGTGE